MEGSRARPCWSCGDGCGFEFHALIERPRIRCIKRRRIEPPGLELAVWHVANQRFDSRFPGGMGCGWAKTHIPWRYNRCIRSGQDDTMKVAQLTGPLLDYWVACSAGLLQPRVDDGFCWIEEPACDGDPAGALDAAFMPSTDWSQGGPIIEAERIHIAAPAAGEHEWK